jgi:hypothetical protein
VDHHTGTISSGLRFLNTRSRPLSSHLARNGRCDRQAAMLDSLAVPGFRVLLLLRAEALQRLAA